MQKLTRIICLSVSVMLIFSLSATTVANESVQSAVVSADNTYKPENLSYDYVNNVSVRVLLDNSYQSFYGANTNTQASSDVSYVGFPFSSSWAIEMSFSYGYVSPTLPDSCNNSYTSPCTNSTSSCGSNAQCLNAAYTNLHHKNFSKNLNYFSSNVSSSGYDLMLMLQAVPYCGYNSNTNSHASGDYSSAGYAGVVGVAQSLGKYSIVTMLQSEQHLRLRAMQHEISHNFGCRDNVCSSEKPCVMSGGYDGNTILLISNIWCENCRQDFNRTAH